MRKYLSLYKITNFFRSPLGLQIKYYIYFYFILWGLHLVIISLISYFHLLLNHNIRTIGDWIGDRGWSLIILSKLLIFYFALLFIRLKNDKNNLVRDYFRNSVQVPRSEVVAAWLFALVALMGLGEIKINQILIFQLDRMILSILGTFIFFSVDYILLVVLEIFFPLKKKEEKLRKLFIFPFLFYLFTYATFIYEQSVTFKLYAFFFLLLYAGEWRRRNWTIPLLFLVLFIIPCYALFGLDPVWGANYTFFKTERSISVFSIFLLIGFVIGYLHHIQKFNPEYIYRE